MRNTAYLLLVCVGLVAAYAAAFAVKRQLAPSAFVLVEGTWLVVAFAPAVVVVLFWLWRRRALSAEAAVSIPIIFALGALGCNYVVAGILDRSVTLYLLNSLDNSESGLTEQQVRCHFLQTYFDGNYALGKRLREQVRSGRVGRDGERFVATANGRAFMTMARWASKIYNLDRRIVDKTDQGRAAGAQARAVDPPRLAEGTLPPC